MNSSSCCRTQSFFSFTVDSSGKCMVSSARFPERFVSAATALLRSIMKVTDFSALSCNWSLFAACGRPMLYTGIWKHKKWHAMWEDGLYKITLANLYSWVVASIADGGVSCSEGNHIKDIMRHCSVFTSSTLAVIEGNCGLKAVSGE